MATLLNLVQTAVLAANKLNLLVPLFLLEDASYLKAFSPEQLQALSYMATKAHGYGFGIGLVFFGFACLVRGYLIFKCGVLAEGARCADADRGAELPGQQLGLAAGAFVGIIDFSWHPVPRVGR